MISMLSPSSCNEYMKTSIETVIQIHTEQPPGNKIFKKEGKNFKLNVV